MEAARRRVVLRSIALALTILGTGTIGYMVIEHQSALNAFYMTAITVTTVGFREAFPLSPAGQTFTIMLAFGGVGGILLMASEFARAMIDTDLRRMFGIRRDLTMIKKLSNHIVVLGYGRMGRAVVEVRQRFGIIVVALKRGDTSTFNPGPDEHIEAGDVLVALGPIHALERIEKATQ